MPICIDRALQKESAHVNTLGQTAVARAAAQVGKTIDGTRLKAGRRVLSFHLARSEPCR
jgi:hypothetical protein